MIRNLKKKSKDGVEKLAVQATSWIGSPQSLLVHTILFAGVFLLYFLGLVELQKILIIVTTIVSYEAIYLSIFIQMSVNRQERSLEEVAQDVEEIHEDVEDISKDVDEIQEDIEGIEKDVDEIQEDVEGIEKDVDEIQKDVDDISEEIAEDEKTENNEEITLNKIERTLEVLINEINELKKQGKKK